MTCSCPSCTRARAVLDHILTDMKDPLTYGVFAELAERLRKADCPSDAQEKIIPVAAITLLLGAINSIAIEFQLRRTTLDLISTSIEILGDLAERERDPT